MNVSLTNANVEKLYIPPGAPWENGSAESFHSRLRDEFLNAEEFDNLLHARVLSTNWRLDYNHRRPHSALDYQTPAEFAATCVARNSAPASLLQRRADRRLAVSFTQRLALDMRMWDVVLSRGRVGFEGNDFIRSLLIEPVPMQHDLKRSQADVFQRDRVSHDGDRVLFQVAVEFTEFGLQGIEFVVDLPQVQRRLRRLVRQAVDLAAASIDVPRKNPQPTETHSPDAHLIAVRQAIT